MEHCRWLGGAALALVLAGCHHKTVAVQPPPAMAPSTSGPEVASERPAGPSAGTAGRSPASPSAGTATVPQMEPQGRPISVEVGLATWYLPTHANAKAADGSVYDPNEMTAAHRELPMGSIVRVTNLTNNESVVVRITDRGPFFGDRLIDLSMAAAKVTGVYRAGVAKVRVEAYAPPAGYDPAGKWCVQIGAFADEADAIQLKNDLLRRYAAAKVIEFPGQTGYFVRIHPQNLNRATAMQIADSIHIPDPGVQPYLVRLN